MCIDFIDTTPVVVLLVYVNDFCYYRNYLYTTGTGTGTVMRKNRSMRVPVKYSKGYRQYSRVYR